MKILGRILIILAAFTIVIGVTYAAVNAGSSSASATVPAFERGGEGFPAPDGERPEFDGKRPEFGGGWIVGFMKNIGIIAVVVALITIPKSFKRRKIAQLNAQ
jgi:hypothetical protein